MNYKKKHKEAFKSIISQDDLLLYKDLGNGFYELPCNIITNEKGKAEFLEAFMKQIRKEVTNEKLYRYRTKQKVGRDTAY